MSCKAIHRQTSKHIQNHTQNSFWFLLLLFFLHTPTTSFIIGGVAFTSACPTLWNARNCFTTSATQFVLFNNHPIFHLSEITCSIYVLQSAALHWVKLHCYVLSRIVLYYIVINCIVMHCMVLHSVKLNYQHCIVLYYIAGLLKI